MIQKGGFLLILFSLLLSSCRPANTKGLIQASSPTNATSLQSTSPNQTVTATKQPTGAPIPTPTDTATQISTSTPPPTLTPLPTYISYYQNYYAFEQLYANNAGCELPCWWGITPGVTTWDVTLQFINRFREFNSVEESKAVDNLYIWNSYAPHVDVAQSVEFAVSNRIVSTIHVPSQMVLFQFPLHVMLQKFGVPSHIYIGRDPHQNNDSTQTNIIAYILFEASRIMIIIPYLYGATENNQIPSGGNNLLTPCELWNTEELFLWAPDSDAFLNLLRESEVKMLEQISPMTVEGFYEKYRHPLASYKKCIELKDNYWK